MIGLIGQSNAAVHTLQECLTVIHQSCGRNTTLEREREREREREKQNCNPIELLPLFTAASWMTITIATNGTTHILLSITGFGEPCIKTNYLPLRTPTARTPTRTTPTPTTPVPNSPLESALFTTATRTIDSLLQSSKNAGVSPEEAKKIFIQQDHTHKSYIRNPHGWAASLDLTPISPWNSNGQTTKAGVLVSPRHLIWAKHYGMPVNTTVRFVDQSNNVVERTIVNEEAINSGNYSFLSGFDIVVGVLDNDVPSTISFAKVLPANMSASRPSSLPSVPVLNTDFEEKALVADWGQTFSSPLTMVYLTMPSSTSLRYDMYEPKIVGDSGNPVFMVEKNELVLLFVFTYGGAGAGSSIVYHHEEINNIMLRLGGGYKLTDLNMASFMHGGDHMPDIVG
ncbi:hypothetical protein CHS0354_011490 [Potamilus streckersoni]|uniref:Uncharacterized protein n=1 Tax=Potamilus streckersoni TaxID=2493646 RepID=A0AAE0SKT9_9BIVA|nr:hypothetical protein CHS0354_011490 [Potamilus streckersoni]